VLLIYSSLVVDGGGWLNDRVIPGTGYLSSFTGQKEKGISARKVLFLESYVWICCCFFFLFQKYSDCRLILCSWVYYFRAFSIRLQVYKQILINSTRESLEQLEKAFETLACSSYSLSISWSPKRSLVLVCNRKTGKVFCFLTNVAL